MSTVKVEREALLKALETVRPALQTSGSIAGIKHFWFDKDYVYAFNGGLGIRLKYSLGLKLGLPGAVLMGLLQSSTVKEAVFDQEAETQVDLKLGRSNTTIMALRADHNPWPYPAKPPAGPVGVRAFGLTKEFIAALRKVRILKTNDPKRVEHYGVVLFPEKEKLAFYTTDSKSLIEAVAKFSGPKDIAKTVLPHGFVTQLVSLPEEPEPKLFVTKDSLICEAGKLQVCSNLLDTDKVWDLPKLVSDTCPAPVKRSPLPDSFGEGITRAEVLTADMDQAFVTLVVGKRELELNGRMDHGQLEERFPVNGAATGRMVVGLERLKTFAKDAKEFAIVEKALVLYGPDTLYLIAKHESERR